MTLRPKGSKTIDPVLGSRLVNAFWLAARFGGATLQFRLLAQALAGAGAEGVDRYQGTLIACLGIAWLAGKLVGRRLSRQAGRVTWGIWLLATALAWSVSSSPGFALRVPLEGGVFHLIALVLLAFLLAQFSSAWITQERPWPPLREGNVLIANLIEVLAGLCTAWILPAWSGTIGVLLLLPLLSLDLWPAARCPLPEPRWARGAAPALPGHPHPLEGGQQGQAAAQSAQAGWWWSWLASRHQLSLTLLASGVTIITASLWLVVPTLYAWELARSQSQEVLLWLLGGQLCALLLSGGALSSRWGRRLLGPSASTMAPAFHRMRLLVGWGVLVLAAICLAALGNPWLQAPWLLGLAIAVYTLAFGAWLGLFPRLLRETTAGVGKARPLRAWLLLDSGGAQDLAKIGLARDEFARRCASRWENAFLMGTTLLTGTLCDQWGVDPVLVLAGCALIGVIGLAMLTARYIDRPIDTQGRFTTGAVAQVQEFPATDALQAVAPSSRSPVRLFPDEGAGSEQEPMTAAQHTISVPGSPAEHDSNRFAAQFSPFPPSGDEEGGFAHDNNGRGIH